MNPPADPASWWQYGTVYQIYPRSFQDSDGDGIGDLAGITARLDHLVTLGVDALWISPVFASPMVDFGYDISDYTDIDPMFGTLADFDGLVDAAHARGLKVILDFVPSHTSDEHPWFAESRASKDSARRDWYTWTDPAPDGGPPNAAWKPGMSPPRSLHWTYTAHQRETHDAVRAMRGAADEFRPERVLIGEVCAKTFDELVPYYGEALDGFQLPFNFELMNLDWEPATIAAFVDAYEAALPEGAWPNWVLGNHDASRIASRVGPERARLAAMLLLTLRGTPTIYQGEELGLADAHVPAELVQDPWERRVPGIGLGRDPVRTPMPWEPGAHAGFTTGEPWLPVDPAHLAASVAAQVDGPGSMLTLYRRLLALRRAEPALAFGDYRTLSTDDGVLTFERTHGERRFVVALNFADGPRPIPAAAAGGRRVLGTHEASGAGPPDAARLAAGEGVVLEA